MIPSPASSCISAATTTSIGNNVCCIITNTNATLTTSTTQSTNNEIETPDITIANDTKNNLEQYLISQPIPIKDFSLTENTNNDGNDSEQNIDKNYQENNDNEELEFVENQQQEEEDDDIIIDVNNDDDDDYGENYTDKSKCAVVTTIVSNCSGVCQKLHKRKDLNRTLTPKQIKIYEEISSTPKTNTKIINRNVSNSSNNKTATNIIS